MARWAEFVFEIFVCVVLAYWGKQLEVAAQPGMRCKAVALKFLKVFFDVVGGCGLQVVALCFWGMQLQIARRLQRVGWLNVAQKIEISIGK